MIRAALLSAVAVSLTASIAPGQSYRTVAESRRLSGEQNLVVDVEFAVGKLRLVPGNGSSLYQISMVYDEEAFEPDVRYRPERGRLDVGLSSLNHHNFDYDDELEQRLDLTLSPEVPLDLRLQFGAAHADLELGGLALRSASVETGASESVIRFSTPNRIQCERLSFEVGAAQFSAEGLGNAHCRHIDLKGAVGEMTLDLTGAWSSEIGTRVSIEVGLGDVTLVIPENIGVRMTLDRFLVSVERDGFLKRGSDYYTRNYDDAETKILIEINGAFGNVDIDWVQG